MHKVSILLFFSFCISVANANNLQIGTPSVNTGKGTISFTISWENSWYVNTGPNNWDAVWIFIKKQSCNDNLWVHAPLSTNSMDHSVTGSLLQVDAVSDGMGVFVRRSSAGNGNIAPETVTLTIQSGINDVDNYQVFGIEMINIPQGNFYLGDGTKGTNESSFGSRYSPNPAVLITSNFQTSGITNCDIFPDCWGNGVAGGVLPPSFPLGYNRFYSMKYEISQAQFAAFLNSLTFAQQVNLTSNPPSDEIGVKALSPASPNNSRNSIGIQQSGIPNTEPAIYGCDLNNNKIFNETSDGQNLACNYLKWSDLMSYLDWAALRPMTEFEFEKICRGEASAVLAGERAWGSKAILKAVSTDLTNAGQADEISNTVGNGLCAYGANKATSGPLRCGFAATSSTKRAQAGASYYGVMELSGNVMEQCIGGQNFDFSNFTTINGDGQLNETGFADTAGWPTLGGGQNGGILRGGNWFEPNVNYLNVSDRAFLKDNSNQARDRRVGGRGVRSW